MATLGTHPDCPWCISVLAEQWSDMLCAAHRAECLGCTVAELED